MSLCILSFLGPHTGNLNQRVLDVFTELGFAVELPPGTVLTQSPPLGILYLKIKATPPAVLRLEPATDLLMGFGYSVWPADPGDKKQRARLGVRGPCTYQASSRTDAGRSPATASMQELMMAVLAKVTGGDCLLDGDDRCVSGDVALEKAKAGLMHFGKFNFDAYARRFDSWPPAREGEPFTWPAEILPPPIPQAVPVPEKKRFSLLRGYKLSWLELPGLLLVLFFLVVTLIYS